MLQMPLFVSTPPTYYRIPSLAVAPDGTVLAFASKRKGSLHDFGHETDVVLRRSTDGGRTWGTAQVIATREGTDIHHGPAVLDGTTGTVLKFCRFWPTEGNPLRLVTDTPYSTMRERGYLDHVMRSTDNGQTWSPPAPVPLPFPAGATSAATGNGVHGIQLADGRLLVQGGYILSGARHTCVLYSDDHGETWKLGARAAVSDSIREFGMALTAAGELYVNVRAQAGSRRIVTLSRDHGGSFDPFREDPALLEPRCHAGLVRHPEGLLLFSNPAVAWDASTKGAAARRAMTVRLSADDGETWSAGSTLWAGPAGYSDLAVAADGSVLCLYERGERDTHETVTLTHVSLDALRQ